jgi:hypothetical protein
MQVAMSDPSVRKVRGKIFSKENRINLTMVMRKFVDVRVISWFKNRIRIFDEIVGKTKRKFTVKIASFFKSNNDRAENEGLAENFKMNKQEIELRSLCDLALVI